MSGAGMRDRLTAIIGIVLLLGLAGATYWYSLRARLEGMSHQSAPDAPDFIAKNIVLTQFDEQGRAKRKLFANELTHYPDDRFEIVAPRMLSLRPDEPQVEVSARSATVENGGERAQLTGAVRVSRAATATDPALRFDTETLTVLPDDERYFTDAPVTMERGTASARGTGLDFDNVRRTVQLKNQVQTVLAPSPKKGEP